MEVINEHAFPVTRPCTDLCWTLELTGGKFVCTVTESEMEKPTRAEHLQTVGVYYEGIVDDARAVVEGLTVETVTTFGTRQSQQQRLAKRTSL